MTNQTTRCAIITGASGGIGGAVAKRLAKDGFSVVVNYAGKLAPAEAIVTDLKAAGGQGITVQADVANVIDVERLFKESMDAFGKPEVVVHCAGIMPLFPIGGGDVASFDKVIATNLRGAFLVLAQAAQHVPDGGRIMAFSSSVLAKSFPGYGAYIASKAGVEGMVHVLANELRGRNICVNVVAPGPTGTDLFFKGKSDEQIDGFKKMSPLERIGTPLTARGLVLARHTVYAGMRETTGRNATQVKEASQFAAEQKVDLRAIEMDVASQQSCDAAIQEIVAKDKRLDVIIHNAGHMVFGPAETFTPEQYAELYDVNVLSTQRVNRAALPQLRKQGRGLVVWVSSSSSAGGTPPYLAPYFAAKAGMDRLAVVYAIELARWGIETSIVVPGAFTGGTNHFAHAGSPEDKAGRGI